MIQVWVVHHCGIIGETVNALPMDLLDKFLEIPWRQIIALRNRLIHEYFGTDTEVIWTVAEQDLPVLRSVISRILAEYTE